MKLIQRVCALAIPLVLGSAVGRAGSAAETAKPTKVLLGVFAHPDDETGGAGLLARAAAGGWEVRVIFATSGDAGEDVSGRKLKGRCDLVTVVGSRPAVSASRDGEPKGCGARKRSPAAS